MVRGRPAVVRPKYCSMLVGGDGSGSRKAKWNPGAPRTRVRDALTSSTFDGGGLDRRCGHGGPERDHQGIGRERRRCLRLRLRFRCCLLEPGRPGPGRHRQLPGRRGRETVEPRDPGDALGQLHEELRVRRPGDPGHHLGARAVLGAHPGAPARTRPPTPALGLGGGREGIGVPASGQTPRATARSHHACHIDCIHHEMNKDRACASPSASGSAARWRPLTPNAGKNRVDSGVVKFVPVGAGANESSPPDPESPIRGTHGHRSEQVHPQDR
jgi:hypothetical protein